MKKIINLFFFLLIGSPFFAQSDVVVFSDGGERFYLIVNGLQYNQTSETNVRASGLQQEFVSVKVVFENQSLGEVKTNANLSPGNEVTFKLATTKNGEYKLKWFGEAPISVRSAPKQPAQPVQPVQPVAGGTTRVTTTTTTTSGTPDGGSINMGINVPGVGGIGISVTDNMDGNGSVTYSETTTTTTTTGGVQQPQPSFQPANNGRCYPMDQGNFNGAMGSIESKDFEATKLTLAKQIASANCLTAVQVGQVMRSFDFENTRLEFAKYAYSFCFDPQNYYQVNDSFEFESSISDLSRFTGH